MWVGPPTMRRSAAATWSGSASLTVRHWTCAPGSASLTPWAMASATSCVVPNMLSYTTAISMPTSSTRAPVVRPADRLSTGRQGPTRDQRQPRPVLFGLLRAAAAYCRRDLSRLRSAQPRRLAVSSSPSSLGRCTWWSGTSTWSPGWWSRDTRSPAVALVDRAGARALPLGAPRLVVDPGHPGGRGRHLVRGRLRWRRTAGLAGLAVEKWVTGRSRARPSSVMSTFSL